jgi:hypothetical protein
MPAFKNITGLRFGRLVALEPKGRADGRVLWLCRCDCSLETIVKGSLLASGHTRSCGCLFRELLVARNTTHGQSETPTWWSWHGMHERCRNPRHKHYKSYGGRGIGVDDPRWNEYPPFREDMGEKPPGAHLHRIENDKGYSKENCVWLSASEHAQLHAARRRRATFRPLLSGASQS